MGRPKATSTGSGGSISSNTSSTLTTSKQEKNDSVPADVKLKEMLKELYKLIHDVQVS